MLAIFKSTSVVIKQLDDFLDVIDRSGLIFSKAIKKYIGSNHEQFHECLTEIDLLEGDADDLRREIEDSLYRHSLLPDLRSDILQLLERMDDIVDVAKESLEQFDIESPFIPEILHKDLIELSETSTHAVEALVLSVRSFFRDPKLVKERIHRVYFYEKEADKASNRIKRIIFKELKELDLSQKQHLRHFTDHLEKISDLSESIADTLAILAIKRSV
jgi:predicted phosphate transport protein (TIGR00153 family)